MLVPLHPNSTPNRTLFVPVMRCVSCTSLSVKASKIFSCWAIFSFSSWPGRNVNFDFQPEAPACFADFWGAAANGGGGVSE